MTVHDNLPNKKLKLDKSNNDESRQITNEDYENDLRHKPIDTPSIIDPKGSQC